MPSGQEKIKIYMKTDRYSMSFTTGGLFHQESVALATLFLEKGDWEAVRDQVLSENSIQARTLNTLKRVCREILSRLKTLDSRELELLVHTHPQEQGYLLWMAVCRRYRFIAEFAREVLRERFLSLKTDLHREDFDAFFNEKAEWHSEVESVRPATRNKLRQMLFKMMREADLLADDHTIRAAILTPRLLETIPQERRRDVLFFPAVLPDLKGGAP